MAQGGHGSDTSEDSGKGILCRCTSLFLQLTLQYVFGWATEAEHLLPLRDRTTRLWPSLYADDAAIFINLVQSDVNMVMAILSHFGQATALKINVSKSSVVAIHCSQINLDEVLSNFSGQRVPFPISCLGLPITLGRLKITYLQFILD
jgi:hypothetical protein